MRQHPKTVELNPFWFKAYLFSVNNKFPPDISYFSSKSKDEAEKYSVPGHIVVVKSIEYDTIIKELETI